MVRGGRGEEGQWERFLAMSGQQGWEVFGWADVLAERRWSGRAFCGAGDLVWWADEKVAGMLLDRWSR